MPTQCTYATTFSLAECRRLLSIRRQWPQVPMILDGTLYFQGGYWWSENQATYSSPCPEVESLLTSWPQFEPPNSAE